MSHVEALASMFGVALLATACKSEPSPGGAASAEPVAAPAVSAPEGTNTSSPDTNPLEDEIRRFADRELDVLPAPAPAAGTGFTFSATGATVSREDDKNGALFKMDIGTAEPVSCIVYADLNDAGATLRAMVRSVMSKGSAARVIPGALLVEGERPVQRLDVLYKKRDVPAEGSPVTSVLKLAWIGDLAHPALCYQDELGYSRTFTDVARRLASTLSSPGAERPRQVEILRSAFGEVPVGFDYSATWVDASDATRRRRMTYSLSAVPMGPGLETRDTVVTVSIDDAERLHGGRWTVSTNGILTQNLTLEKTKRGFTVSGSTEGKPVSASFPGFAEGLAGDGIDAALGKRVALASPFESTRKAFVPLTSPEKLLEQRVVHGAVAGEVELRQADERTTRIIVDADGRVSRSEVTQGQAKLTSEVLFARDGEAVRASPLRN